MVLKALLLTFCGCTGLDIARGSNGQNPFGIVCGSENYWILTFAYVPFTTAIAAVIGYRLVRETSHKEAIGYPFQERGSPHLTHRHRLRAAFLTRSPALWFAGRRRPMDAGEHHLLYGGVFPEWSHGRHAQLL